MISARWASLSRFQILPGSVKIPIFGLTFSKSPPDRQIFGILNGVLQDSKRKGVAYEILQKSLIFEDFEGFRDSEPGEGVRTAI